jgi:hypothetical protein
MISSFGVSGVESKHRHERMMYLNSDTLVITEKVCWKIQGKPQYFEAIPFICA